MKFCLKQTPFYFSFMMSLFLPEANLVAELSFPVPTGSCSVGTRSICIVDKQRKNTSNGEENRRIMVQLWYPIDTNDKIQKSQYFPPYLLDEWKEAFATSMKANPEELLELDSIKCHSVQNAAISKNKFKYPLIVFCHGNECCRFQYTALCEELASYGYVIAAADHTKDCSLTQYPDGTIEHYEEAYNLDHFTDDLLPKIDEQLERWRLDVECVIDSLLTSEDYIDKDKIGIAGHSLGGAVAALTGVADKRIKACALLDAAPIGPQLSNSSVPFICMIASTTDFGGFIEQTELSPKNKERFKNVVRSYQDKGSPTLIFKAGHTVFSDNAILKHLDLLRKAPEEVRNLGASEIDGFVAIEAIREYLVAFFNQHLHSIHSPLLNGSIQPFSDFVSYKISVKDRKKT